MCVRGEGRGLPYWGRCSAADSEVYTDEAEHSRSMQAEKRAINKEVKLMFKDAIQKERKQRVPNISVTSFK